MKRYPATFALLILSSAIFAQTTFQASIQPVSAASAVTVMIKTSEARSGRLTGATIAIAIPISASATAPPLTVSFPNTYVTAAPIYQAINQNIDGTTHYIYNIVGTGDAVNPAAIVNFTANTDIPLATVSFGGDPTLSSQIKLVSLADGGTDPSPNSFFGLSIDGLDVVSTPDIFYSIVNVSTVVNDGQGYSGTSYAITTGGVVLPVKFLGFEATRKGNSAVISWMIENENSLTDRYEVERSLNGSDFTRISTVPAKGNGKTSNSYELVDADLSAIPSAGIFYYRVKQLDKNGQSVYTGIKSLRLESKGLFIGVYPNPVTTMVNLAIDAEQDDEANISISDASGKQVKTSRIQLFKGANTRKIKVDGLASGTYLLKVQTGTEIKTVTVIKTK